MTQNKVPPIAAAVLTQEQIDVISGAGECTPAQLISITSQLKTAYEDLVDFTSHVIERVVAK
jgi:hypothetical protein